VLLLEIAAQGVKGVSLPGGTVRLRPGYNVVAADGAALRRLVETLLYPGADGAEELRLAAPPGAGAARAGATLLGDDGVTYRLVRELGGGLQLQRLDPQRRAFALVSQDLAAIARQLEEKIGVPPRAPRALLTISSAELPSRHGAVPAGPGAPAAPRRALTPAELTRRVTELKGELERARRAEKLQYQLDGLQGRLFKLEETLREGTRLRDAVAAAQEALSGMTRVVAVAERLGDPDAKLAAYAKSVAKRDDATARLDEERAALDAADVAGPPSPFWKEPRFWAAAGAGVAAAAAGVAGSGISGLRYLALLDIPAFGWAAWVALGWVGALEDHGRLGRRRKLVDDHARKVKESFERETADVREALAAAGAPGLAELTEALHRLGDARFAVREAEEKLAAFEARPETRSAQEEKGRVEVELRAAEAGLGAEAGGYVRDPRSVEAELDRLEAELAAGPQPAPAPPAEAGPAREPLREVVERAAEALGGSPAAAVLSVQQKASQAVQALSGNRLSAVTVDDRGTILVQVGGRPTAAVSLPGPDRDLAWLALKLAFLERALAGGKRVAVADDVFAALPEAARRVAGRVLKLVARQGQLVHGTTDVAFREAADHAT
jgi:hypothetical protein